MKRPHFALPEIYDDSLSYYDVLRKLIKSMHVISDNLDKIPEQIANEAKARLIGDQNLQQNINSESTTREQADTALQQNINSEATTREQADQEIREDVSNKISELKSDLSETIKFNTTFIDYEYVTASNGVIRSYTELYSRTDYTEINGIEKIGVSIQLINPNVGLAFYDKDKKYISGCVYSDYGIGEAIIEVPNDAKYVICTCSLENKMNFYIKGFDMVNAIINNKNYTEEKTAELYTALKNSVSLNLGTIVDGFVNSANGKFIEATSYKRTEYIPIISGVIDVCITYNVPNVGLAFYDKDKRYIGGHDFENHSYGEMVRYEVPVNAKYIAYCCINGQRDNMSISYPMITNSVVSALSKETINPCEYTESKECMVFNKILCIGDSLTDGQFDYKESGTTREFNDKRYAYPTFLKALSGRDITNVGDAGETTVSWFELHGAEDFTGHDACIIALGRNDYVGSNSVSTSDRIIAMNNIINKVKTDNPQIKIFVCTQINYYSYAEVGTINDDMKTVVNNTEDCYLLDIHTYGNMLFKNDAHSHCTAVGYYKLAQEIFNYISYVMHNNPSEFKTIQFTGTNRSY